MNRWKSWACTTVRVLLVTGTFCFHPSETRKGIVSWYAMLGEQPSYAAVKKTVTVIFDGSAKPLQALRWPPGKGGVVVAFDNNRLK
jgi:hypothetical protein